MIKESDYLYVLDDPMLILLSDQTEKPLEDLAALVAN